MKLYDFDKIIDRKNTDCIKYDTLKENFGKDDLIPLWVADMDFCTPDFIVEALKKRCEHPVFGYTFPSEKYFNEIIRWLHELHGWEIRREWLNFIPGIVKGIAFVINNFTQKGDKIIIQPPVYHPFRSTPENLGRRVVCNPLRLTNSVYEMDFEHLESVIDEKCKVLILSNPHNPAGIVWKKETLQQLASICVKHNILVISDEIHSEMIYPSYTHFPFPTVSDEAASCSITFSSPSKTFNIAGIVSSYSITPNEALRKDFHSFIEGGEFNNGTIFSYVATKAAYTQGTEWRKQMLDYVRANVQFTDKYLKENIPQIKAYLPQASFLVWLNCRGLRLNHNELISLFTDKANLALNSGAMFGDEGNGYMRINVGCPRSKLHTALEKLRIAVNS